MSLRVGLVCPYSWDVPGGVRSHVADLAVTLRGRGHSVNVLAPVEEESVLPDWVTDGGRPVAVPYNGAVARLSFGVKATRRVRSWIRAVKTTQALCPLNARPKRVQRGARSFCMPRTKGISTRMSPSNGWNEA